MARGPAAPSRKRQGTQPFSPSRTTGQIAPTKSQSLFTAHRCTQSEPSVGVSVFTHTPWSGQSALVVQVRVHSGTCRREMRLKNTVHCGVDSAQIDDD